VRTHGQADLLRQGWRRSLEARSDRLQRLRLAGREAVVEKAALVLPDEGSLIGGDSIAELEARELAGQRLPDEQVEIVVVEPAAPGRRFVGKAYDLVQHGAISTMDAATGSVSLRNDV